MMSSSSVHLLGVRDMVISYDLMERRRNRGTVQKKEILDGRIILGLSNGRIEQDQYWIKDEKMR